MGGRHLTDEDKKGIREMYIAGVAIPEIAYRFRTSTRTAYVYTLPCGDREFSSFRDGRTHNGKRGRKRIPKLQLGLDI
jgi:hypothetical protein